MAFKLGQLEGQSIPPVVERDYADGSTFKFGALVLIDANGDIAECGANPASIAGVSLSDVGPETSGFVKLGQDGYPLGKTQVVLAQDHKRFLVNYEGNLPAALGGDYDVIKSAAGDWHVNFASQAAARVRLVGFGTASAPLNGGQVLVEILDANIQQV